MIRAKIWFRCAADERYNLVVIRVSLRALYCTEPWSCRYSVPRLITVKSTQMLVQIGHHNPSDPFVHNTNYLIINTFIGIASQDNLCKYRIG